MKDLLAGVRAARLLHTLPTLTRQFALVCSCILPSPAAQTVSIMVIRCLHQNALQPHAISELLWVTRCDGVRGRAAQHVCVGNAHNPTFCRCHRSLAVVGYRPGVRSLTCFDVLRAAPQLLPALVSGRDSQQRRRQQQCAVAVLVGSIAQGTQQRSLTAAMPAFAQVRCRQLVWDAAEAAFDAPSQLWVEHTALITWDRGASIGWHHDSNRCGGGPGCC